VTGLDVSERWFEGDVAAEIEFAPELPKVYYPEGALVVPRVDLDDLYDVPATEEEVATASWLIDAADLLAEPDPGPTRFLVEDLIVDQALVAAVGRWKTTKTYGLLDIAISVRTGRSAFGALGVNDPGPVVFVIEESGRAALWRRLDALCRGRGIDREELRGLHLAANARVKLDDREWQERLIELGKTVRPRLFVFDPLARMKPPLGRRTRRPKWRP
jgi:AAA domain